MRRGNTAIVSYAGITLIDTSQCLNVHIDTCVLWLFRLPTRSLTPSAGQVHFQTAWFKVFPSNYARLQALMHAQLYVREMSYFIVRGVMMQPFGNGRAKKTYPETRPRIGSKPGERRQSTSVKKKLMYDRENISRFAICVH